MSKALIVGLTLETSTIKSQIKHKSEKSKGPGNVGQFHHESHCKISSVLLFLFVCSIVGNQMNVAIHMKG